jgi:hypothetical protein
MTGAVTALARTELECPGGEFGRVKNNLGSRALELLDAIAFDSL